MRNKKLYKSIMAGLAGLDIVIIVLDFAGMIHIDRNTDGWYWVNNIILLIFAVDYFRGLYLAKDKGVYFKGHIFDLLAIIPVGIALNWMELAQLGNIVLYFKTLRLVRLAGLIGKLRKLIHTEGILYLLYFSLTFLILGSVAISITEHVSLDKAFWWAITTASTVGYGDISKSTITPNSLIGKAVILVMILVGVGVMGMVTSSLTAYLMRRDTGKNLDNHNADLQLILNKLDALQKQNDDLVRQNKVMQEQIKALQSKYDDSQWDRFKNWMKEKKL